MNTLTSTMSPTATWNDDPIDVANPLPLSSLQRRLRGRLVEQLTALRECSLVLEDADGSLALGDGISRLDSTLCCRIRVIHPDFYVAVATQGSVGAGESYMDGHWRCDDLVQLVRVLVRNRDLLDGMETRGVARIGAWALKTWHALQRNTRQGSRRNIAAHYDLGNALFELFLDNNMMYSSALFAAPDESLERASTRKLDRICQKLDLRKDEHVIEIGTGWGGFAIHAARHYGVRVTTTTLSREQRDLAQRRIAEAGLSDRIDVLLQDYRDLQGTYDKLVSIEMIEAVGHRYLDAFFGQCSRLLVPDGSMVLQAIVMPERGYPAYLRSVDFLQRYIFPGGCVPSLGAMLDSVARATDLRFVHAEDLAPHYAETLRRWRIAFHARINDVRQLGYSETFLRMWHYYLCYCEAAFEERYIGVLQVQFDKPECRRDPIELSRRAAGACTL